MNVGKHRHKSLLKGAFGKKPPKHVGKAECNVKRIGRSRSTKISGNQHVTNHTRDA